jgi:hypothetical protein
MSEARLDHLDENVRDVDRRVAALENEKKGWRSLLLLNVFLPLLVAIAGTIATIVIEDYWQPEDLLLYYALDTSDSLGDVNPHISLIATNLGRKAASITDVQLITLISAEEIEPISCNTTQIEKSAYVSDNWTSDQDKKWIEDFLKFGDVYIGKDKVPTPTLLIEAGKNQTATVNFVMKPVDWTKAKTLVVCLDVHSLHGNEASLALR